MSKVNYRFFQLNDNEYAIFPVGNHVQKYIFLTNTIGKEICEYSLGYSTDDIIDQLSQKYLVEENILKQDVNNFMKMLTRVSDNNLPDGIQKNQESIRQRIITSYCDRQLPYNVFIELTYNCNLRCPHCYIQDSLTNVKMMIEKEKVFEILDDLEKLNVVNVYFTGGEAALHPDLIEILRYASSKNILVILLTNGQLLTEYQLDELEDIPLYDIQISLYGNEQEHDSFVKKQGAFKKVNEVLQYLQKKKGIGTAAYVLSTRNCNNFSTVFQELNSKEIPVHLTTMITPTAEGNTEPTKLRITDRNVLKRIYQEGNLLLNGSLCNAGVCRFRISPKGDVNPCEMMHHIVFGNVFCNKFSDILYSQERMNWISYFEKMKEQCQCSKCEKRQYCSYCPGSFYQETGSFEIPSPYYCFITEIKQELANECKNV